MATLYVKPEHKATEIISLLKNVVQGEISRLELTLPIAANRLAPFEQKYKVSSDYFIEHMTAENLAGGDDEYVQWAGEYKLQQRLQAKLQQLRELSYGD
jgi:hypothetical protein